ncbi:aminopeptidase [Fusibacter ferrireducens]|uniref:Aminopeptidase n=1 Tax=Fusibacter ferrireducens TaxID=2785058 RepID=A0ABR9ZUF7_9FIRM|nr:aminopeptidase [Fusibacter ferrireducens]MBF4694105.1 aminopeptidase [Fusibacter ferrireducens]
MFENKLKKYAELLVKIGVNLKKNQILVIRSPIECADFTRMVTEIAYREGAREVVVSWGDEKLDKIKYTMAPDEIFDEFPEWQKCFYVDYAMQDAAFLTISASDPEIMKAVDTERLMRAQRVRGNALTTYRERTMNNINSWCVASVPTLAWAKKVFPNVSEHIAIENLWAAIFNAVRVDSEDPVAAWELHKSALKKNTDYLNRMNFKTLKYKNSMGTDLTIELPEHHIWFGGSDLTKEGHEFIANMPTEEIFTAPKRNGVHGKVVSSKPLNLDGNLIDEFELVFKEGRIVDFSAKVGYEALSNLINVDEGAHYLGEVALVSYDSPISNSNILFYNTLFDENASCHLAIGKAYPVCIKDGDEMSSEDLIKNGINDSLVHEDFMVGTSDLNIVGITQEGEEILIFKEGNFAIPS